MKKNSVVAIVNRDGKLMALLWGLLLDMVLLLGVVFYICLDLMF